MYPCNSNWAYFCWPYEIIYRRWLIMFFFFTLCPQAWAPRPRPSPATSCPAAPPPWWCPPCLWSVPWPVSPALVSPALVSLALVSLPWPLTCPPCPSPWCRLPGPVSLTGRWWVLLLIWGVWMQNCYIHFSQFLANQDFTVELTEHLEQIRMF